MDLLGHFREIRGEDRVVMELKSCMWSNNTTRRRREVNAAHGQLASSLWMQAISFQGLGRYAEALDAAEELMGLCEQGKGGNVEGQTAQIIYGNALQNRARELFHDNEVLLRRVEFVWLIFFLCRLRRRNLLQ